MARPLRLEFPQRLSHVTARGNERCPIVRYDARVALATRSSVLIFPQS